MSQSEEKSPIPVTDTDDSSAPQLGLQSSDPDPSPSELDRAALEDGKDLHEQVQNLDLEEEKGAEEENDSSRAFESADDEDETKDDESENGNENETQNSERKKDGLKFNFPVRPDAEDCAFYMKTGMCKFGSACKFNHPIRRKNQAVKEKVNEGEESSEKPGQMECKFYLRTGGCKFGKACRYNHSRAKTSLSVALELNFIGLPIRPGEKECPYYMRNGSCKYGVNCRFNHPDPTAGGGSDPPSEYVNGVSVPSPVASQGSLGSWSSPRALNKTTAYMPLMFPPAQGVPSQSPEWNGYQAPVFPPEQGMNPAPAYVMNNLTTTSGFYANHQPPILIDEFPERPGQPECVYFLKTGDCKFRSNCRYHHPKTRIPKPSPCPLSDKGLPLRPDQNICSHYSRYGICKFGPACKFDHPIQTAPPTIPGLSQPTSFGDSSAMVNPGMPQNNSGGSAVQQSVM